LRPTSKRMARRRSRPFAPVCASEQVGGRAVAFRRHACEPFRVTRCDALTQLVVVPHADHLAAHAALRGIEVDAEMIAAAVVRERNPLEVVPVVADAGIGFRRHAGEIAAGNECPPDRPLRDDLLRAEQRIAFGEDGVRIGLPVVQPEAVDHVIGQRRAQCGRHFGQHMIVGRPVQAARQAGGMSGDRAFDALPRFANIRRRGAGNRYVGRR